MANRSYLYSANFEPSSEMNGIDRRMTGISEWKTVIPITFKILLSGNPRKCRSSIWEFPKEIAIVGDYDQGVDRLFRFLDRISLPEIAPLKEEARRFLADEANKNRYFILECGEIFELVGEDLVEQNDDLLAEIRDIDQVIASALVHLPQFYELGLGHWSNLLYFDLRQPR
jgi:hypothetical protein